MTRHGREHLNLVYLNLSYDPPGSESQNGPRHDNDHVHIKDIQIVPTQAELICERPPYLPSNDIPGAPHHLPPGWSRQLDIQFRLNREDMIDQLRQGIVLFLAALNKTDPGNRRDLFTRNRLRKLMGEDVSVNAYGNVELLGANVGGQLRGSIKVSFDQPPQIKSRPKKERKDFWERSRRRLIKNSLVCFIYPDKGQDNVGVQGRSNGEHRLFLGVVDTKDFAEMAEDEEKAIVHVKMIDNNDYCQLVLAVKKGVVSPKDVYMVESLGGYFESYRPILQALQLLEPNTMPFSKYLVPMDGQSNSNPITLASPRYALDPNFEFDLSVLLSSGRCHLNVKDPLSRQRAVAALRAYSTSDDTQSQALVNSLCREVALISGPPGTGKTKIGVDLVRVLIHNAARMRCGPILCICYSDHALDQFLEHLLDQGINRLVRIGSRSSKRLEHYNLYDLTDIASRKPAEKAALSRAYNEWNKAARSLKEVDENLQPRQPSVANILRVVARENGKQYFSLKQGHRMSIADDQPKTIEDNYLLWSSCGDLEQIEKENENKKKMWKNSKAGSSRGPTLLPLPSTARQLNQLRQADLWMMSRWERKQLVKFWVGEAKKEIQTKEIQTDQTEKEIQSNHTRLMERMQTCATAVDEAYDAVRRRILRNAQLIGVTTYGAAKNQTLIATLQPKIVICEEAGEVLESHILTALSKFTQHLILIGDHLQLRPKISTYELSSESRQGKQYNLDRSLFERLITTTKVPSSLLTTQRRMRPEICNMVRHTLYPELVDGEKVLKYPNVSGMATNVFFMSHHHPEDRRDQYLALSASNTFEAKMVKELVQHLLKNGYQQSNIAVLTPYINQLTKLRDTLHGTAQVAIDERDQEQLDEIKDKNITVTFGDSQSAGNRLILRTIDNYQGEEADIIIISLVRSNTQDDEHGWSPTIGFLRSPNRTSVLLSRARHGMYMIGNAELMNQRQNGIWPKVMTELGKNGRIGEGFLLRCRNHPHIEIPPASSPEAFKKYMPNGSCTNPCSKLMPCSHRCPRICHFDDQEHKNFKCDEPCARIHRLCGHRCTKQCIEDCGDCHQPIGILILPCGHKLENAYCPQKRNPYIIQCKERVIKRLPHCEHKVEMDCCKNASSVQCKERVIKRLSRCEHEAEIDCCESASSVQCKDKCEVTLKCGHSCTRSCHECQSGSFRTLMHSRYMTTLPDRMISRTVHGDCQQRCAKALHCGHICDAPCHLGTDCPPCKKKCEMACSHTKCNHFCATLCSSCCEPCAWTCPHQGDCKLPCGAPCSRLPCNQRCQETLLCGHQCPSLCGEQCPPSKYCVECKSDASTMEMVVDLSKQTPLSKANVDEDPILVLPCGHALNMSSLDNHMRMTDYYYGDTNGITGVTTFFKTKPLSRSQLSMIGCHSCHSPIVGLRRYGRRFKYAQLAAQLKKFEMAQMTPISTAEIWFRDALSTTERNLPTYLDKISRLVNTSIQEVVQKNIQAIWQVFSGSTPSSSSEQDEDITTKPRRVLGRFTSDGSFVLDDNISSLFYQYDIPGEQGQIWLDLIAPALGALKEFNNVRKQLDESPIHQLFKAADVKARSSSSCPDSRKDISHLVEECARECGLPPDGQAGSSFVRSIQGRVDVLLLILGIAICVFEEISLKVYHDHPSACGWYTLIEDLLQSCIDHSHVLCDAAIKGKYTRLERYAKVSLLGVYLKRMQLLGHRPFDRYNTLQKKKRNDAVHDAVKTFDSTLAEVRDIDKINNLWVSSLPMLHHLDAHMETACKVALGELKKPPSGKENREIFRNKQIELSRAGRWYRCLNGHSNRIIGNWEVTGWLTCPDCGARISV